MNPSTIMTYVNFRGDISFARQPYNEADLLALTILSYLDLSDLISDDNLLAQVAEKYREKKLAQSPEEEPEEIEELLYAMGACKRYRKVRVLANAREFSDQAAMTFYATAFQVTPFQLLIAIPGTDSTLLSWKENFTFLYKENAPGLEKTKDFLLPFLKRKLTKVTLSGHSKGGVGAVYGAMNTEERLQNKIKSIYLFDAPGFIRDLREDPGYLRIMPKIKSYIPEDSVVGRAFQVPYPKPTIVKTDQGKFAAHELLHWCVGPDGIERGEGLSEFSDRMSEQVNALVYEVEPEHRETVINEMFDLFFHRGITELSQVKDLKLTDGMKVLWDYRGLSPETKTLLKSLLKILRLF